MKLPIRLLALLTVLALAAPLLPTTAATVPDAAAPLPRGDYIVGFHVMPDLEPGDRYEGYEVVEVDPALRFAVVATQTPAHLTALAHRDPNVRYIEWDDPHYAKTTLVPNDPLYSNNGHYGSKIIRAEQAWDRTLGAASVKVAVIDSGLRKTHEEFAGQTRILQGYDTISEDNDPEDRCGHGTHVAGTIAATINNGKGIAGMAQVSIYPIRALSNSLVVLCSGSSSDLAQALRLAGDVGAHLSSNSWGGGGSSAITDAISYAHGKNVIQVAAAGNDGSCTNCVSEPWRSNHLKVIVVSSTTRTDGFSSFSSQGPQVDVSAPGSDILSTYSGSNTDYATLSGTSMATPHVTGVAALVKTMQPSWLYADIDSVLKTTAKDLGPAGKDDRFGHGRVDADNATAAAAGPSNAPPTASFSAAPSGLTVAFDASGSSDSDGTIVSYSWSFGDGNTGSGVSPSHTYAAAGTYTVTLTVTDNGSATATTTATLSVSGPDPDPGATTLTRGVSHADSISGVGSEEFYKIEVPTGATGLYISLNGNSACTLVLCDPQLDLYVRHGARPTDTAWDCRPATSGNAEACSVSAPSAGWWYVRVKVVEGSATGDYAVTATYNT